MNINEQTVSRPLKAVSLLNYKLYLKETFGGGGGGGGLKPISPPCGTAAASCSHCAVFENPEEEASSANKYSG